MQVGGPKHETPIVSQLRTSKPIYLLLGSCCLFLFFSFLFLALTYACVGSGYFDVRAKDERWVRVKMGKGDMITLPAGMYHRFTLDDSNYIKVCVCV